MVNPRVRVVSSTLGDVRNIPVLPSNMGYIDLSHRPFLTLGQNDRLQMFQTEETI